MIRQRHKANYGLFITFSPRDGVENETLNEQNTLRCLLVWLVDVFRFELLV